MHETLVCVRLTSATPGSRLLDFLRSEPFSVAAWWIAADVDAMVRMASTSRTALNRAVADLRRRSGRRWWTSTSSCVVSTCPPPRRRNPGRPGVS
jgi:hypothetical protein